MGYGILRGQKIKTGGVAGIDIHNNRRRPSRSNPDIDRKRTAENYSLLDEGDKKLTERVAARVQELSGGRKIRSDAVKLYDFIATASPEDMERLTNTQIRQYFKATLDFLIKKYGRKNIMYAHVHMDEKTPHMHVGIVPEYQGRLCAKKLFTPSSLRKLQDDYFSEVTSKYGLQRGEVDSKRKHSKTQDYKRETNFNGKEKDNLKELEKVIKARPVEEGFFQKEVVGYQISPAAADELLRLARVGGQAADEKERADRAEQEKEKALEREKSANQEAARLRTDFEGLQMEKDELQKDFSELKKKTDVYTKAPERMQKKLQDAAARHAERRDALHAFVGRSVNSQGLKKAAENPAVNAVCRCLGKNDEEREGFLKDCGKMMKTGRGADSGDWSPLPAPLKCLKMPIQTVKKAVEQTVSAAKNTLQTAVNAGVTQTEKEISEGFRYLKEHDNEKKAPWSWLTELEKDEIKARQLTAEDDY